MKPKLTTENKAKIFALYWGQEVAVLNDCSSYKGRWYIIDWEIFDTIEHPEHENDFYLELRPLSSITDEEIDKIISNEKELPKEFYDRFRNITLANCFNWTDELRLLGIAQDWCGWSVEELVKEGVFVLKE